MAPSEANDGVAARLTSTREFAPAKLNLNLGILGRRPDGRHELDSLTVFLDIGDSLCLRVSGDPGAAPRIAIDGPQAASLKRALGPGEDDSVARAVAWFTDRYALDSGIVARLDKRLPVAAGLGGGSADAAAALRALHRLCRTGLAAEPTDARLAAEIADDLGADVPACLGARPCWLAGIGERLNLAPMPPTAHLVLACPDLPVPTGAVFAARRGPDSRPADRPDGFADLTALIDWLAAQGNDLQSAAVALFPPVGEALAAMAACPGCRLARMSGSGGTVFGLFDEPGLAARALAAMRARRPRWWLARAGWHDGADAP